MLGGACTCWGARSCCGVRVRIGRCAFVFGGARTRGGARACVGGMRTRTYSLSRSY